ncbi:MAG: hypothetical protein V1781_07495 [Bacteroidota bacterium]
MPLQDVIQQHFTTTEQTTFNTLMSQLEALLQSKLRNLSEDENNKYGVIKEQNKLFVNKVSDYRNSQPTLSSPDVDWKEFAADFFDRSFLENGVLRLDGLVKAMTETRRLHDYDNYQNSLIDYKYTKYKNDTQPGSGFDVKEAELKQFFPGTGTGEDTIPPVA